MRFNTQPPEGGWADRTFGLIFDKRFNTQPPEGGWKTMAVLLCRTNGFNTQPPEGGWFLSYGLRFLVFGFQHTAA